MQGRQDAPDGPRGTSHPARGGWAAASIRVVLVAAAFILAGLMPACEHAAGALEPAAVRYIGQTGTSPGQLLYPRAIDADGRYLWIIDKTARIQRMDPATGLVDLWWTTPVSVLGKPTGITVLADAVLDGEVVATPDRPLVMVVDTHYHRVLLYRPPDAHGPDMRAPADAEMIARFGAFGDGPGQFVYPTDVAVLLGEDGRTIERFFVSEYGGNDRVQAFDDRFAFEFEFGEPGSVMLGDEGVVFERPQSLAIVGEELIVADACNHRLGRFTLDGEHLGWIEGDASDAADGGDDEGFRYPYGLTAVPGGVLVTEFGGGRVRRVDLARGGSMATWGGSGELVSPWAAAVVDDDLHVLDSRRDRIAVADVPGGGS
ncbi:MAG: hypothetical protein AAFX79_05015 [Planctomycetota bacterium]